MTAGGITVVELSVEDGMVQHVVAHIGYVCQIKCFKLIQNAVKLDVVLAMDLIIAGGVMSAVSLIV